MQRKTKISILVLGALALLVGFGATVFSSVKAATNAVNLPVNQGAAPMGRGFGGGAGDEELAAALGITVDELTAARKEAQTAALKQAVDEGLITQAQADELSTNGKALPFGGRWDGWLSQKGIDAQALLAKALGITVEELQSAQMKAFEARIDQAVTDGQLTQERADLMKAQNALRGSSSFQTAMQSAYQTAVQAAVEAGVITQAQADLILADHTDVPFGPGGKGGMDGFGGPPHGGRHGGMGESAPGDPAQP